MDELPRNDLLADQFDLLGDLMELNGGDSFRVGAYRRAAARIRETPTSVAQLALDGRAVQLQDIGKTIQEKIVEVVEDGEIHALTKRKAEVPEEVAKFMRLPGLGPKTARRLWQELGITTVDALKAAAEAGQLKGNAGIGAGTEQKIVESLARPEAAKGPSRALLGTTLPKLRAVVEELREHPASVEVDLAGSARRMRETVRDLDIIATRTIPTRCSITSAASRGSWTSPRRADEGDGGSHDGLRYDLRVVPPESYGNLLQHFTGSKNHNVALREDAVRRGLSVSEYSVTEVESGEEHSFATEQRCTASSATTGSRRSCARTAASSPRRARASCRCWSSCATCVATCTRTRPGRTGRTRSRTWSPRRSRAAMRTTRSATTRSGCAAICCSARRRRSTR
jgi:DNA polymerase IV (family X)